MSPSNQFSSSSNPSYNWKTRAPQKTLSNSLDSESFSLNSLTSSVQKHLGAPQASSLKKSTAEPVDTEGDFPTDALINRIRMEMNSQAQRRGAIKSEIERRLDTQREQKQVILKSLENLNNICNSDSESVIDDDSEDSDPFYALGETSTNKARNRLTSAHNKRKDKNERPRSSHHLTPNPKLNYTPKNSLRNELSSKRSPAPRLSLQSSCAAAPVVPPLNFGTNANTPASPPKTVSAVLQFEKEYRAKTDLGESFKQRKGELLSLSDL
ncbi:hypothetical protein GEMRC1_002808 [Eukaryota sp. GEM-RC1]